jgi:hypothetical protein
VIRHTHLIAVVVSFLIAGVVVGCGSGPGYIDERGGEEDDAATIEEITAPKGDRSAVGTAQEELVGFDEEVVSPPGQANVPAGFGEGSLWATGLGPSRGMAAPPKALLKRVDPQTGEVVEEIPLGECVSGGFGPQAAVGADSMWVSSSYVSYGSKRWPRTPCDVVLKVDPQTKRVVDRIPVDPPTDLAFGHGSVWVSSGGKLVKVDPETNEVAGMVSVGAYYSQLVVNGGGVWAMGQGANEYWLVRVDPSTIQVVGAEDSGAFWNTPGLAAGGGYVWFLSGEALARVSATRWQEQTTEEARCEGTRTIMMAMTSSTGATATTAATKDICLEGVAMTSSTGGMASIPWPEPVTEGSGTSSIAVKVGTTTLRIRTTTWTAAARLRGSHLFPRRSIARSTALLQRIVVTLTHARHACASG